MAEKKKFFSVEIPLINEEVELFSSDIDSLIGRNINLDMTRTLKGKGIEVSFRIVSSSNPEIPSAIPRKVRILPYFIRRMLRKRSSYVEDSFVVESKEGTLFRVKPFLITRKIVSRAVRNALRLAVIKYLNEYFKAKESNDIFDEVLFSKMQKPMLISLKKVYPLSFCDLRAVEIVDVKE